MSGLLVIDKPAGVTSAEVVRRVKRRVRVKVGHLGTLDPFATGVLPLCLGEATKIAQFLSDADKTYEGLIRLGAATDTGDRTGTVVRTAAVPSLDAAALDAAAARFTGTAEQRPPMYSALKQQGVPLYELARRGVEVERAARPITITALTLALEGADTLRLTVSCSKGTYVRVLAEDIGLALGTVAHLEALRRTRFGHFTLDDAVTLEAWTPAAVLPIGRALGHLPVVRATAEVAAGIRRGQVTALARLERPAGAAAAQVVDPAGRVVAVVTRQGAGWAFGRVLNEGA